MSQDNKDSKVSREDIVTASAISKIVLSESEIEKYQKQLQGIVEILDKLNEIKADVEPLYSPIEEKNFFRKDIVEKYDGNVLSSSRYYDEEENVIVIPQVVG